MCRGKGREGWGDGEIGGVNGTSRRNLLACPVMTREAFKPEGKTAIVTLRVTGQIESNELVGSMEAPQSFQTDHPSEVVSQPRLVGVACAARYANAEIDGGRG